ncbi:uncharacterized protein G2W53_037100 [Senna tora]|uniref:Uncharacterized protein n=1 Tax=Senna tora TaxID=362788 RepID=A0A834SVA0_9FABA|nr:uncharacterized protein G2W53_037100 [Senna tora]
MANAEASRGIAYDGKRGEKKMHWSKRPSPAYDDTKGALRQSVGQQVPLRAIRSTNPIISAKEHQDNRSAI